MRSRLTPRLVAALLAALALFVSACGSDEVEGEVDSSIESGGDTESTDSGSDDDGGDAASSGLADDDAGDEATSEVIDAAGGGGDFCDLYVQNQNLVTEFDFFDSAQVEEWLGTAVGLLDQAISSAPSEIRGDLELVRGDFDTLAETLEANDYDFFAASEQLDTIDTPEIDAATDRIDAYVESVCGVDPDQAGEDFVEGVFDEENIDALLGNDALFNQIIGGMTADGEMTEEQATCLLSNLDGELISGLMADGGAAAFADPAVLQDLFASFEACGIELG